MPFCRAGVRGISGLWPGLGGVLDFDPVSAVSLGASGPLFKVSHWLDTFPGFWPSFGLFSGASGPLDGVDHWLRIFPGFRRLSPYNCVKRKSQVISGTM